MRGDEDGSESGYYAFCSVFLRRDEDVGEGDKVLDLGRRDRVDVTKENVEGGSRLWEIDVGKLVGRVVRLRKREHVPKDGRGDGQDASVDPELLAVYCTEDEIRVFSVERVGHPQLEWGSRECGEGSSGVRSTDCWIVGA